MSARILVLPSGRLVRASDPYPESIHDVAALDASGLLEGIDPSGWIGDKGYIGRGMITPHKKPPNGELSETAKEENKSVNKIRRAERAHHRPHQVLENPPHTLQETPGNIRADHHRSTRTILLQDHPLNNLPCLAVPARTRAQGPLPPRPRERGAGLPVTLTPASAQPSGPSCPGRPGSAAGPRFARTITSRLGSARTRARGRPGLDHLRPHQQGGRHRPVPARHRHPEGRLPFRIAQMLIDTQPDPTAFATTRPRGAPGQDPAAATPSNGSTARPGAAQTRRPAENRPQRHENSMNKWDTATIDRSATSDDLRFAPYRVDSVTLGIPTWIWPMVVDARLLVRPRTACAHAGTLRSGAYRGCSFRDAELRPGHSPTPTILLLTHT